MSQCGSSKGGRRLGRLTQSCCEHGWCCHSITRCPEHGEGCRSCLLDMQPECQLPVTLTCFQPLVVLPLSVLYLYRRITWNIDSGVLINWSCSKYSSCEVGRCFSCRTGAVCLCRELPAPSQLSQSFPWDMSNNFSKSGNGGKRHKQHFLE